MTVEITEGCIGCGLCTSTCPEVFRMNDEGVAEAYCQPSETEEADVREAAEGCPVSVILTEE